MEGGEDLISDTKLLYLWKVKPCERDGYYRTYYMDTPDGDHLEVDYNHSREMVQINLTLEREGGRQYTAIIKSGTIIRERDVTSARPVDLTSRLGAFHKNFGYLREEPVLRAIGGNYGIPGQPFAFKIPRLNMMPDLSLRKLNLLERLRNYLQKKRIDEQKPRPFLERIVRRMPAEMLDAGLGILVVWAYFAGFINITELAGFAGFLGLLTGAVDWVWRQRNPFLLKVAVLLGVSAAAVFHQVQLRLWTIWI